MNNSCGEIKDKNWKDKICYSKISIQGFKIYEVGQFQVMRNSLCVYENEFKGCWDPKILGNWEGCSYEFGSSLWLQLKLDGEELYKSGYKHHSKWRE